MYCDLSSPACSAVYVTAGRDCLGTYDLSMPALSSTLYFSDMLLTCADFSIMCRLKTVTGRAGEELSSSQQRISERSSSSPQTAPVASLQSCES